MDRYKTVLKSLSKKHFIVLAVFIVVVALYLYKLGSLTSGVSITEVQANRMAVGWHGIYHDPFYLPLKLVRSVVFFLFKTHGQTLTRLPNVILGILSIGCLSYVLKLWHGKRTAIFTSILFITSAWTLHVSRLASFDVMYLFAACAVLLAHSLMSQKAPSKLHFYLSLLIWGSLITIPGCIFIVIADLYILRDTLKISFNKLTKSWQDKTIGLLLFLIWLPLTVLNLTRAGQLKLWLGLPSSWGSVGHILKDFVAVPIHLFIRGPEYPQLWLGKAPVLSAFTLVMALLGVYFYARHFDTTRSRTLAILFGICWVLIALGGAVSFSLIVPFAFLFAGMGISYFLHMWFKHFPNNPLAKKFGVGLISLIVLACCIYNIRAYFVAWPSNAVTLQTFSFHLRSDV